MQFRPKSQFWKDVSPTGALADFMAVYRQAGRMRWRIGALSLAVTYAIFSMVIYEEHRIEPRPPKIIYITSWHAGRTDAEIMASNIANERAKEAEAARLAHIDDEMKGIYKSLGRVSGMDVDKIEADAKADAARDAKAQAARQARLYGAGTEVK